MAEDGLNRWTGLGRLGADPELRFTQTNMGVLSLRMACSEGYSDSNTKERKERTEWVSITIFGKRAEALNKFLHKGSKLLVEGRLETRTFDDKQGVKQYRTGIVANNVVLLDSKGSGGGQRSSAETSDEDIDFGGTGENIDEDRLPF